MCFLSSHLGKDFDLLTEKRLVFHPLEKSKTMRLVVYDNREKEGMKEFTISIHPDNKRMLRSHAHFFIRDNDGKPSLSFSVLQCTKKRSIFLYASLRTVMV